MCVFIGLGPINNHSYHNPSTWGVPDNSTQGALVSVYSQMESGASRHILGMYLPLLITFNNKSSLSVIIHSFCLVRHVVIQSFSDLCWAPILCWFNEGPGGYNEDGKGQQSYPQGECLVPDLSQSLSSQTAVTNSGSPVRWMHATLNENTPLIH